MHLFRYFAFGLFLSLLLRSPVFCAQDGDWQIWPRISLEGTLRDVWKVYLDEEFRIGDGMSDRYFHRTDFGIGRRIASWLSVELHYWHSYAKSGGVWIEEQRPFANVIATWRLGCLSFKDRNRFEFRIFNEKENRQIYRNALTVTPPFRFTSFRIQPYLTNEIFIQLDRVEFVRNRIYIGLKVKPLEKVGIDLYYMLQEDLKQIAWYDTHVAGIKVKVTL